MKQIHLRSLTILMILLGVGTFAQGQSFQFEITEIQKKGGEVMVAIYSNEEDWLEKPFKVTSFKTSENSKIVTFDVPYGTYAISVYQDSKPNGELDQNFLGIPKEPIAFGNNYKPLGNPDFESAAVKFNSSYEIQTIKLYTIL